VTASQQKGPDGAIGSRVESGVLHLTLNRPEKSNAYTQPMLQTLESEVERGDADPQIRCIVITGSGDRAFCAGADRNELGERDWKSVLKLTSARVFRRIRGARCVTVAAVNGAAVGGGMELAAACDLRVAVAQARFWLPEPELGLLPAAGGIDWVPRLVGPARARELILGGARWDAETAREAGFLSEIAATLDALPDAVTRWTERILRRDPEAIHLAKKALDLDSSSSVEAEFALLAQALLEQSRES